MRRWLLTLLVLIGIGGGGYYAYSTGMLDRFISPSPTADGTETAETAAAAQTVADIGPEIVVDGRLVPVQSADLSLTTSGIVAEVLVQEGVAVKAGDLILRLDPSEQQVAVAQAQAELQRTQAQLAELSAGPRSQEIASAEAALSAAKARYNRLAEASLPGDIAAAEAAVNGAQAGLAKVMEGVNEQQLIAARADLANAEAARQQAQRAYDKIKWRNDIGAMPESAALQQATNNYEAAQARLAELQSPPSQADVASASAQVRQSQAQLNTLRAAMPSDLIAAEADVQASQAQLDLLLAGTRSETIAVAEAQVAAATAALQQTLVGLRNLELRAPFTGTVASIELTVGEQITPGTSVVRLADLSRWQIETADLTELDVVGLTAGNGVQVAFDALPGLTVPGTVSRIRPIGEDNRGDIVYTAIVTPQLQDERFLWNMTAVVTLPALSTAAAPNDEAAAMLPVSEEVQ